MPKYLTALFIAVVLVAGFFFLRSASRSLITELTPTTTDRALEPKERASQDAAVAPVPAPYWELPDLAGNRVRLADFSGKPLILTFWTTWHPRAVDQLAALDRYSRSESALVDAVAISSQEDAGFVRSFVRRGSYKVRVLSDQSGAVLEQYAAHAVPVTFFINRTGAIVETFIGVLSEDQLREKSEPLLR